MFPVEDWIREQVPLYEEWTAVGRETLFRIKLDTNGEIVRFLVNDEWYWLVSKLVEGFRMAESGVAAIQLSNSICDIIRDVVVEIKLVGISFAIFLIDLAVYLVEKSISIGKFTYKSYGYGEVYGRLYSGGTVTQEYPVTT